jgi:cold-inducible RNA-binding protein
LKRLYVGNLSFGATVADLAKAFGQFGTVSHVDIKCDRQTGQPRGFAFLTMEDGADRAIEHFNGKSFLGRMLAVSEARPRPSESKGGPTR